MKVVCWVEGDYLKTSYGVQYTNLRCPVCWPLVGP